MQMALPTFSRKTERNKKVEGERQLQAFTKQITRSFLPHSLVQCNLKHLQKYYIVHSILYYHSKDFQALSLLGCDIPWNLNAFEV